MSDVLAVRNEYRAQRRAMLIQECSSSWLMEGLKVDQKTAIRKGKAKDLF